MSKVIKLVGVMHPLMIRHNMTMTLDEEEVKEFHETLRYLKNKNALIALIDNHFIEVEKLNNTSLYNVSYGQAKEIVESITGLDTLPEVEIR